MAECAYQGDEWRSAVYTMVDDICVHNGAFPPGTMGALTRIMDTVLVDEPFKEARPCVEGILVAMHRFRASLMQDAPTPYDIRAELRRLSNEWMKLARFC